MLRTKLEHKDWGLSAEDSGSEELGVRSENEEKKGLRTEDWKGED